ncbi:MAG: hypothetical protein U1C70_02385 [Sediminibacterium sp.]|jgi:hypothetical protein|uniref:hypothetical protein n=1 Tax=Sediminibacterium sp. TaxID=1917865 RepID=UPI002ABBE013|nr:hypothetical protein [Sediminibacterium sp.]MDZ4070648.1 hypothetical protein [Sediminibacterium sp.]
MKQVIILFLMVCFAQVLPAQSVDPVSLVVAKVIKAIDLKIQKLQNETIWLQRSQQVAEETLSKNKLVEINDWQKKQQQLYATYFNEMQGVNGEVKSLPHVKQILSMQVQVAIACKIFAKDPLQQRAFDDLLQLSRKIIGSLQVVLTTGQLTMKDAERIVTITTLRDAMVDCLDKINLLNKELRFLSDNKLSKQTELQILRKLNQQP